MRKIEAVRRRVVPKTSGLPAVLVAAAIAAACGGPAAVLHDVLDEAEDRVDFVLDVFDDTEDEMNEAAATELPPCPAEYEPPPLWEGPPPYEDAVERPADLPDPADQNDILSTHRAACRDSGPLLLAMPGVRDQLRPQLEDFSDFAEAMRNSIDDDMTDEQIETLSAEVDAVARARPDAEDTLQLRYERLLDRMLELSPLVREMARGARRPGAFVNPGAIPYPEAGDDLAEFTEPWTAVMETHAEAQAFFEVWNNYRRRIYEGPDTEDPDEAAADWTPLTGVWTGEYARSRTFGRENPDRVRITFEADGTAISYYPDSNCGGALELTSTSGAFGRVTQYRETLNRGRGRCVDNGTVTLDRTGEDRLRFHWTGFGESAGNLTRQ